MDCRLSKQSFDKSRPARLSQLTVSYGSPTARFTDREAVFVNKEVHLGEMDVYGFDYDLTLVTYTSALAEFIFRKTFHLLVWKWKVSSAELASFCILTSLLAIIPSKVLYFMFKGLIMKVDAFNNIQADTVHRGLQPVPVETVKSVYNGLYIASALLRGDRRTEKHHMTQVMDFFSLPAVYVVCSVIEHFKKSGINFQPECIYTDVRGNLDLLRQFTKWSFQRVLFVGDHVYYDLADASNQWGWATAAVIPELETEIEISNTEVYRFNLRRLMLLEDLLLNNQLVVTAEGQAVLEDWRKERDHLRLLTKVCFNEHFGSIFRSFHNPSYFSQRLGQYASMYTSSVNNLLALPVDHTCYPRRTPLPHE
ncbi:unnamed protein product [Schistocephalus solidus]|uniref:5'-nucleotidase domain-containing protein 3 n=1 Tax=Schistocephalus solidus TaxID=70667 RepID=A0A183SP55_SCHSO|nr:unnamed protein product [Schistocephalus solidus]